MSLSSPSQVSATTGKLKFTVPGNFLVPHSTTASRVTPTLCVLVSSIGPFQKTRFLHPCGAGHFPVAVKGIDRRRYRCIAVFLSKRQNGCHPGADRSLADNEFPLAFHQRCLTNLSTPAHP